MGRNILWPALRGPLEGAGQSMFLAQAVQSRVRPPAHSGPVRSESLAHFAGPRSSESAPSVRPPPSPGQGRPSPPRLSPRRPAHSAACPTAYIRPGSRCFHAGRQRKLLKHRDSPGSHRAPAPRRPMACSNGATVPGRRRRWLSDRPDSLSVHIQASSYHTPRARLPGPVY